MQLMASFYNIYNPIFTRVLISLLTTVEITNKYIKSIIYINKSVANHA